MNLTRCENGHFYDASRFDECPHCNQTSVSTVMHDDDGGSLYTAPLTPDNNTVDLEDVQKTIGYFKDIANNPVVGWLVAISGTHFGEDFKLVTGKNFIGRSTEMDVALTGDASVSREKHAIILYEPKGNVFLVQPGDAKELFYLNDNVVLAATEIKAYDVLTLGDTKLLFVPCCSDKFKWDSVKADEKE